MGDFLELGIEAADKLVDKHFHKVPDSALHIHTYHPKNIRKSNRRKNRRDSRDSESEAEAATDPDPGMAQSPRPAGSIYSADTPPNLYAIPPQYSREPPRIRPQYIPSPPPIGGGYYSPAGGPPYSALERMPRGRDFDDNYYSDSYRRSPPRRPKAITRRSSSYHGPRSRDGGYESSDDDRQIVRRRDRSRDTGHRHGFKEEIEKNFTKSPAGVTGGIAGAIVGGWAAKKAQTARHGKDSNMALTALGAAVGGLAVNAIIDKWEDRKEDNAKKEAQWEDKFGPPSDDESDGGRRGEGRRREKRDRRYSRDSGDEGYGDERGGRGYAPYN